MQTYDGGWLLKGLTLILKFVTSPLLLSDFPAISPSGWFICNRCHKRTSFPLPLWVIIKCLVIIACLFYFIIIRCYVSIFYQSLHILWWNILPLCHYYRIKILILAKTIKEPKNSSAKASLSKTLIESLQRMMICAIEFISNLRQ